MPNWCANSLQISGTEQQIADIAHRLDESSGEDFFDIFVDNAEKAGKDEEWYSYNLEAYGCKWNCTASSWDVDGDGTNITINFDSPWGPPIKFYQSLYEVHKLGVLAYYYEPGMCFAGVFEDGDDDFYDYSGMNSIEIAEQIRDDLDEMFCISEQVAEYEEEEAQEEDDASWRA
jgi:hypothetical protein